jgi:hypothetical protein
MSLFRVRNARAWADGGRIGFPCHRCYSLGEHFSLVFLHHNKWWFKCGVLDLNQRSLGYEPSEMGQTSPTPCMYISDPISFCNIISDFFSESFGISCRASDFSVAHHYRRRSFAEVHAFGEKFPSRLYGCPQMKKFLSAFD